MEKMTYTCYLYKHKGPDHNTRYMYRCPAFNMSKMTAFGETPEIEFTTAHRAMIHNVNMEIKRHFIYNRDVDLPVDKVESVDEFLITVSDPDRYELIYTMNVETYPDIILYEPWDTDKTTISCEISATLASSYDAVIGRIDYGKIIEDKMVELLRLRGYEDPRFC